MWPTQLRSIRSQVTKSTLDVKCEKYQSLSDDQNLNLRNYKVVEWFRRNNSRVVKAIRDHHNAKWRTYQLEICESEECISQHS
jgi:hypothetical protein